MNNQIKQILSHYSSDNPGTITNLYRLLMHGKTGGSGRIVILPVDQGFEHGPDRSFAPNTDAYDPDYHIKLTLDAELSAYAAPIGMLEASSKYIVQVPTILKLNNSNSLYNTDPDQAITGSVRDALRLGCIGVGMTIYPGSKNALHMIEEAREIISEAKSYGLIAMIWSYPRGPEISKENRTAMDICTYAVHIASLMGAHVVKVKQPTEDLLTKEAKQLYKDHDIDISTLSKRIKHVMHSAFCNKRLVVFSGGAAKSKTEILEEIKSIALGGGNGSIIGRNSFQRKKEDALTLLDEICDIYS